MKNDATGDIIQKVLDEGDDWWRYERWADKNPCGQPEADDPPLTDALVSLYVVVSHTFADDDFSSTRSGMRTATNAALRGSTATPIGGEAGGPR